ncbi:spore germination protein GerPE [Bacillus safensis]|uniref:spore germination protein GerPE n=1 Tax=Bacillus safensis TaxID=561879 RepID=UPI00203B7816|nr:spore germination protein GerPE [Bacillus safensis]MCM3026080.1 spore germination protein GerPE [Bacillus safensis]
MIKRTSKVKFSKVNSVGISSVVQIGDTQELCPAVKVLAVQRTISLFYGYEAGNLDAKEFEVYVEPIPLMLPERSVRTAFYHEKPVIKVSSIHVEGVSSSSVYQIGSTCRMNGIARVKHIRELFNNDESPQNSQMDLPMHMM